MWKQPWAHSPHIYPLPPVPRLCEVYWGSHGCQYEYGHEGWCDCGCDSDPPEEGDVGAFPYYGPGTNFYGADAPEMQAKFNVYWEDQTAILFTSIATLAMVTTLLRSDETPKFIAALAKVFDGAVQKGMGNALSN